jgi:hypothetical protein
LHGEIELETRLLDYFGTLDASLETLSGSHEAHITGLPNWVLCQREIKVAIVSPYLLIIRVVPQPNADNDIVTVVNLRTDREVLEFLAPVSTDLPSLLRARRGLHIEWTDVELVKAGEVLAPPAMEMRDLLIYITRDLVATAFTSERAKKEAIDLWNGANSGCRDFKHSFVAGLRNVLAKYHALIKRKAFLERRIHRFVNAYADVLLPEHKAVYFEHKLFLGDECRIADFILERESAFPAVLVELENPSKKIYRKNGELTAEANHARNQIAEWVRFIEGNPANGQETMAFLRGPKQRLIVMGTGLEYRDRMIDSKYTDTIQWTYDMLALEARGRWNRILSEQYRQLGLPPSDPVV